MDIIFITELSPLYICVAHSFPTYHTIYLEFLEVTTAEGSDFNKVDLHSGLADGQTG